MTSNPRVLAAAVVLALTGVAAAQDKTPGAQPVPTPKHDAPPLPPTATKPSSKLAPGMPAPALQVEKWITGGPVAGFEKGKVYILEFWAVWAPQAATLFPALTALQKEFADKGVMIVGVTSADKRNNTLERVEKFVVERGADAGYAVAWDSARKTSEAYLDASEAPWIPWAYAIDKEGKIAFAGSPHEYDLGHVVDRLLAGTWDIAKGPEQLDEINQRTDRMLRTVEPQTAAKPKEAWAEFQKFEKESPRVARGLIPSSLKAELMIRNGVEGAYAFAAPVVDKLIAEEGRLIGGVNRRSSTYLNQIAWAIVDPEGGVKDKNLDLALKASEAANTQTKESEPAVIDTLARVWWLKNDKIKAVELQKKAIKLIGDADPVLKKELEETLKDYQGIKS